MSYKTPVIPDPNQHIAFERLFHAYYERLCGFAFQFTHNHQAAEDIVLDTFFTLWIKKEEFFFHTGLKPYLFKAVQNNCISYNRKEKQRNQYLEKQKIQKDFLQTQTPEETFREMELQEAFEKALEKLPPQCRNIFEMHRFEGLKYHQIAKQLNISPKTVETQMSRAIKKLRLELGDYLTLFLILYSNTYLF